MKFFKLSALALASTLALAGCGDDNNNSSSGNGTNTPDVPVKPPVDNSLSEIEQAKEMIRTAKLFVSDNKAVTDAYEDVSDILTEKQDTRLGYTFDIPSDLKYYMEENEVSQLTAADITALANDEEFETALGNIVLTPEKDFLATLNTDGKFTLTGSTKVDIEEYDYVYNPQTGLYGPVVVNQDNFKVAFDGFEDALSSNTSTDNFNGSLGFKSINIGTGTDTVTLNSSTKGATVSGQFSDKVVVNDEFDINDANREGITLEKAVIKLSSLKLTANDSVIEAKDFEFAALDVSRKLADNSLVVRTIPYKFAITGKMTKQKPMTDVEITLNATANDADIKKFIIIDEVGDIEEAANKYVGMEIVLALKGKVTKQGATTIPLDFQANLKRTARNVIELQGLTASVEGKKLFVTGKSSLDNNYDVVSTQFTVEQNKASIKLNVDANGDFIKDKMGKLGDIMVNGKDYGDLMDNDAKLLPSLLMIV
ncbi:hypothetical protein JCM18903_2223 [Psychrobacter sp. JCM 18903]|uniref:hypothetical protein n=1 Tax=Psychrobacter sp. JCM 18903 TaxID=1298610 RepID=UPI000435CBA3|nr:hypothetical protein [Psychrobacter sp. JCM 18903]GAF62169.1 hypothetical protein JCM18903_2223 [Psychrobacter sp. JCM 18903]